jgi:hypothetical protein
MVLPDTAGLRLVIPKNIVKELNLKFQDLVEWETITKGNKKFACMGKL